MPIQQIEDPDGFVFREAQSAFQNLRRRYGFEDARAKMAEIIEVERTYSARVSSRLRTSYPVGEE